MPDTVLNALQNKLARYEAEGDAEKVERVKARIAEVEKGEKKPAPPMTLAPSAPPPPSPVVGAKVTRQGEKPTVKKAVKKTARKK